jgi:valyl-tRNA synthetase
MKPLPQNYNHLTEEKKWQQLWEENKLYQWEQDFPKEQTFVIDTPPPTVSGLLHMGHIFSYTQADFVARYQRMKGKTVFYPMGFDDNGLPTERLVEKVKNIRGANMPRAEFIAVCKDVVEEAEEEFRALFRSVALSVDWSQEYQTISPQSQAISQLSFLELAHKERAYRDVSPTLWDPVDQTALAQADIEDKEMASQMNDIAFATENGEQLVIATTRPELLAACVAVLYHPEDSRYTHLQGKQAVTPLFGVRVPLIADEMVSMEKGTGLVMCCTFGDDTDVEWWRKHKLPTRIVLSKAGKLELTGKEWLVESDAAEQLEGLKVKAAREKILELLKEAGKLLKQTDIVHNVKCAERSGAPLEILVTEQWFIKILDQKEELLKRSAECNWHPAYMKIRLDNWINGLTRDWCISRQRFFGVPFPVWYSKRAGEEGKILYAHVEDLPVDPMVDAPRGYNMEEVVPDRDVMDTWATSSVSPQLSSRGIAKGYALDSERHAKLFPADMRPQAHEIIRSWAFYTIVKAHLHEQTIPWKNLMISGWCLAADKTKMSKSKGNVVTPVHLIEEKGSDVVRYWASTSRLGSDTAYSEDVLKIGKKLVNKLWNAAKFASIHLDKLAATPGTAAADVANGIITETVDLWVLSRLHRAIAKATEEFERFEYCNARIAAEDFFWNDFCDNYLEIVKSRAYDEEGKNKAGQMSAVHTVYHCLDGILRLFAPFIPHITEELYSAIFDERNSSIHARGNWLKAEDFPLDEQAEQEGIFCVQILNSVRKAKADKNLSMKAPILHIHLAKNGKGLESIAQSMIADLEHVTNAALVTASNAVIPQLPEGVPTEDGGTLVQVLMDDKKEEVA